jgi:hypothetical protein
MNDTVGAPLDTVVIQYSGGMSAALGTILALNVKPNLLFVVTHGTGWNRKIEDTSQFVYSVACECCRSCISDTGRLLGMGIKEHRHNTRQDLM